MSALSREEVARRLKAGRALRGHDDQVKFAKLVRKKEGVPLSGYGALERAERKLQARDRRAIANVLDLPERWFTAPLGELVGEDPAAPGVEERLSQVAEGVARLLSRPSPQDLPEYQTDTDKPRRKASG